MIFRKKLHVFFLIVISCIVLAVVLYWRYQISQVRFFDIDEFTHLNWAASIARGEKPYIDFFTFFTPGFHWLFSLLFHGNNLNGSVFIQARYVAFLFFLGNTALIGILFALMRRKLFAPLAMILFAWLPMPYDKLIEIRPDNISLFFCLLGLVIQAYCIKFASKYAPYLHAAAGVSYAFALIVLVKMVPFVGIGLLLFLFHPQSVALFLSIIKKRTLDIHALLKTPLTGLLSFSLFMLLFCVWLLTLGNIPVVWYSLTKLAFEANKAFSHYIMEPHLFFFPNSSFYGPGTINGGIIGNHFVWVLGIIVGAIRLFTPFLASQGDRKKALLELGTGIIFFAFSFLYIQFYILKHVQYLIPISVFISFYAADGIAWIYKKIERYAYHIPVILLVLFGMYGIVTTNYAVNAPKLLGNNTTQLKQIETLLEMIPKDSEVFDIEGRLLFWKPAYYICCLPFMTYIQHLSMKIEPFVDVLERKKVPIIYQGDTGRMPYFTQAELQYIRTHYKPVEGWGETLWKRIE